MTKTRSSPTAAHAKALAFLTSRDIALKHLRAQGHAVNDRAYSALFTPVVSLDLHRRVQINDSSEHA